MPGFESAERIAALLVKHLRGSLTAVEAAELESWKSESAVNATAFEKFTDITQIKEWLKEYQQANTRSWNRIVAQAPELGEARVVSFNWWRTVAAAIILLAGTSTYYLFNDKQQKTIDTEKITARRIKNDVAPGNMGATLVLANGQRIAIDSSNGMLAQQGSTKVTKQNGQITYNEQSKDQTAILYNTFTTARGQQSPSLKLADGSTVFLDAESSITYPVAFAGNERHVTITGQVYFEVAKNKARPFTVTANDMTVQVLGTHFNINAYNNEAAITTTLLEGSVKVRQANNTALLTPGQQSQLNRKGTMVTIKDANIAEAVAWKEGMIKFHALDMAGIIRMMERWYNVEVAYDGSVEHSYNVTISRKVPLSRLLEYLELAGGVHFAIDGKKVTVTK
jgi:ferric-dicitrate binding protein FerR (iron transport regulator)